MDSFTSMNLKLEPLGIYNLADSTNVCEELKAYAVGIDGLFEELDEMTREYFIDTAETYGITQRETIIGPERTEHTLEKRRQMLKYSEQTMGLSCTKDAFNKLLSSYGLSTFAILERCSEQSIVIHITGKYSTEFKRWLAERVKNDFPTHLVYSIEIMNIV